MKLKALILLGLFLSVTALRAYKEQSIDIVVNGQKRNMICYTPSTMKDNMPLWIVTHGMNQNPEYQRDGDHLYELIDTAKFVVTYLRSDGNTWDTGGTKDQNFVLQTIEEMYSRFKINKNRVYWSGFSMGSMLIYHCMPNVQDKIAAFAPCSGIQFSESPWERCKKPVNLIHCHSKHDDVFPIDQYKPREYAMHFKDVDKCQKYRKWENVTLPGGSSSGDKEVWSDGTNGSEVEIYMWNAGGHWPDRNYVREMWNFCKRFALVEGPKVQAISPEDGAFDMDTDQHRQFRLTLDKAVDPGSVQATLTRGTTTIKLKATTEDEGCTLVLSVPEATKLGNTTYTLTVPEMLGVDGGRTPAFRAMYTYGVEEVGDELQVDTLYAPDWAAMNETIGEGIPKGWRCLQTDTEGKTVTKKHTDSIEARASHLVYYPDEGEFHAGFQLYPYRNARVELTSYDTSVRPVLKLGRATVRFRTIYLNSKSKSNKFAMGVSLKNSSDGTVIYEGGGFQAKNYVRSTDTGVKGSTEQEFVVDVPKTGRYILSFFAEHDPVSGTYPDGIILSAPLVTVTPSQADIYKGGFQRTLKAAKALAEEMAGREDAELDASLQLLRQVIAQYEDFVSILPSAYTAATQALEEAMKPVIALDIPGVRMPEAEEVYDLMGRRADVRRPGVRIHGGRKVVK